MPDKRPGSGRRTPASRPGKGGGVRGRPGGAAPIRRETRAAPARQAPEPELDAEMDAEMDAEIVDDAPADAGVIGTIRSAIADAAEQQSEQRFGSAARRAAILAAVICVLTLTIAGPVRTYFSQRAEMRQLAEAEAHLRVQIADLEQQRVKLADPVFIASQARERLGFVMPGEIPYQVQLPPGVGAEAAPDVAPVGPPPGQPWYTSLWHTISDAPHGVSVPPVPPASPGADTPPPPPPAPGG